MFSLTLFISMVMALVALFIGLLIFNNVVTGVPCLDDSSKEGKACNQTKTTAWTVIGILPFGVFFTLFVGLGALSGRSG